ncbi:MAG: hypothetical protein MK100_01685 [Phycisphaerales bacterium]|nr:hypothetical protein [Phycisphaerales bacterium]
MLTTIATMAAISASGLQTSPVTVAELKSAIPGVRTHQTPNGRLDRVFGKPLATASTPAKAASVFIERFASVWGLSADSLTLTDPADGLGLMHDSETGKPKFRRFRSAQTLGGLPVFESTLTVLVLDQPQPTVVLAAADTRAISNWHPIWISDTEALRLADSAAKAVLGPEGFVAASPTLCVYAGTGDVTTAPSTAIEMMAVRGAAGHANYAKRRLVVDVAYGTVLFEEDMILHCAASSLTTLALGDISGTVSARTNDGWSAWECDATTTVPLPWAYVSIDGNITTTDEDGAFSAPGGVDSVVLSGLNGLWFDVNNDAGTDEQLERIAQDGDVVEFLHNEEEVELEMSQAVAYWGANEVRSWILDINPDYPTIGTQSGFPVNVNLADTCNAFYDYSSINFYQSGGSCNNTAFGHVVYHEYGHHLIAEAGSGQGEYGEGMSDCVGLLMTGDPRMAPGFFQGNCVSGIRTADNLCQYDDTGCSSCGSQIHACGQLISGCVWDTWQALEINNPLSADAIIRSLTINSILLHTGTAIDEAIAIDFVTLDDDDGDISNGSPNYSSIESGFGAHNIDVPPIAWLSVTFPDGLPSHISPGGTTTMNVNIADQLGSYQPGTAKIAVSIDGLTTLYPLDDLGNGVHRANFPESECGSTIPWYLWLKTTDNESVFVPAGGADEAFDVLSAWSPPTLLFEDDATTDLGWIVGGDATDGIWERAIPSGGNGRPAEDCDSGDWCWLTENRTNGGDDVDGGSTTLTSPPLDATTATEISYCWWYRNIGGGGNIEDDIWVVNISDDDGATWTVLDQTGTTGPDVEGNWQTSTFLLADIADFELNDQFRIQFIASDLNETSRVEAAVDNIHLVSIDCKEPPCPNDLDGDGQVGTNEILAILDAWGECQGCPADLDGNGFVDVDDILLIVSTFGPCG